MYRCVAVLYQSVMEIYGSSHLEGPHQSVGAGERGEKLVKMDNNSDISYPECIRSLKNPIMEQQAFEKGPKLGFGSLPTYQTLHCMRTRGSATP